MTLRGASPRAEVHAIVLAAGSSTRMAGRNKLLARFDGAPLIRRTSGRVTASKVTGTIVVTGHDAEHIEAAIQGLPVRIVYNPDFASGLASSLRAGIRALPPETMGALIVLADMPGIDTTQVDGLLLAFKQSGGKAVVRATSAGAAGNPVILPRTLLTRADALSGDVGARHLIEEGEAPIVDLEIGPAASLDVDTAEALAAAGGVLP